MLQKEVDFMPVTPKKSHVSRLGIGPLRPSSAPNSPFKNFRATPDEANAETDHRSGGNSFSEQDHVISKPEDRHIVKTTEQKKELLGFMLGNVDALVEGVKRAGVWGLA
jgi:hypothetical protein